MIARVAAAKNYVCHVRMESNLWDNAEWTEYNSEKHGLRRDYDKNGEYEISEYISWDDQVFFLVDHGAKAYASGEIAPEHARRLHQMSRAQDLVSGLRSLPYESIGTRRIDGVEAIGIEVSAPEIWGSTYKGGRVRLWVDPSTQWPVLMETEAFSAQGTVTTSFTHRDFRWNVDLPAEEFTFRLEGDYRRELDFGPVDYTEDAAIER